VLGAVLVALIVGALVGRLGAPRVLREHLMPTRILPAFGRLRSSKVVLKRARFTGNAILATEVPSPLLTVRQRLGQLSNQVLDHFLDMGCYFLVGVFFAAAMKTFMGSHLDALGNGIAIGPLAMMATAFVLSLCAEADAFVAASFTEFSLPAKIAFLVIGPMFDIKLFLMYRKVFSLRFIAVLAITLLVLIELYALGLHLVGMK